MVTPDQSTMLLANELRGCIAKHMTRFDATQFKEMFAAAVMALYVETARLKHLLVSTGDVVPEDFDKVFLNGLEKHYADHQGRAETIN
jgi:hypothetical protein